MKKILATVDALNFSENELKSYKYIADKARGALTVLFLENIAGEAIHSPHWSPVRWITRRYSRKA